MNPSASVNDNTPQTMTVDQIRELSAVDMSAVNDLILKRLHSDVALINQVGFYIINSGGKRLRPLIVLLAARACGYEGTRHIELAAIVEFIHTATLLHDDVVDDSQLRRGRETANNLWGNEAAVLVGDFLYSRAFEMMVDVRDMRVMDILSHATNRIAEGEVLQLINCKDPDVSEENYLNVIYHKTAKLFEAGAQLGAIAAEVSEAEIQALKKFGMHLGTAFQLIDDVLDLNSTSDEIGKNIGDDLAEGKPTLPLIFAMREGSLQQRDMIRNAIKHGGLEQIDAIVDAMKSTGAFTYTQKAAEAEAQKALSALEMIPHNTYRSALESLAHFAVSRSY